MIKRRHDTNEAVNLVSRSDILASNDRVYVSAVRPSASQAKTFYNVSNVGLLASSGLPCSRVGAMSPENDPNAPAGSGFSQTPNVTSFPMNGPTESAWVPPGSGVP